MLEVPSRSMPALLAAPIALALVLWLLPAAPFAAECPPPCEPAEDRLAGQGACGLWMIETEPARTLVGDPVIQALVDSVSQAMYVTALRQLSGAQGAIIDGRPDTILTRFSGTLGNVRAAEYIEGLFESYGMTVTFLNFNDGRLTFNLDAVSDLVEGSKAWLVGSGGRVFKTEDGGALWRWRETPVGSRLRAVDFRNALAGIACGNSGAIIRTTDGGETWAFAAAGPASNLRGAQFVDATHAWISGESGKILFSSDEGASWVEQSSGTSAALFSASFVSATSGWIVGAAGTILRTTNGGMTWSPQTSGVAADLNAVVALDGETAVAVGASGTILRTTNSGANWGAVTSGTSQALNAASFSGATGWACGNAGVLLKSADGGASWSVESSGTTDALRGAAAWSPSRAWACGNATAFRATEDGVAWGNRLNSLMSGWTDVIGEWTGSSAPEEVLIFGGHFDSFSQFPDSVAPGADDNGTGTVALIEAARVLSRVSGQGCFERTVRFAAFGGEEQGLHGSTAYAQALVNQGENVVGVLNYDAIAYNFASPLRLIWDWNSQWLADSLVAVRDRYVPALAVASFVCDPPGACNWSDHYPFWARGIPALVGIEWWNPAPPYHHTTADSVGTIANFTLAVNSTRLMVGAAAVLGRFRCTTDVPGSGIGGPSAPIVLGPSEPSVFRSTTRIPFWLPDAGRARLVIYDSSGRVVREILDRDLPRGRGAGTWDGRDNEDHPVASGVYFASLQRGDESRMSRLVLVR